MHNLRNGKLYTDQYTQHLNHRTGLLIFSGVSTTSVANDRISGYEVSNLETISFHVVIVMSTCGYQ